VALLLLSLHALLIQKKNTWKFKFWDYVTVIATVGVVLFRNNGKYALLFVLCILFLALVARKERRKLYARMFLGALLGFLIGSGGLVLLARTTKAMQGDAREMLSVPIQQLARVMHNHEDELSTQDAQLIRDFILNEAYHLYDPAISDPVKRHTNTYVARYRSKEFLTTYLNLFRHYPGEYINAFLALNAGYLWPGDQSHATINQSVYQEAGLGYVQTRWADGESNPRDIYKDSKWPWLRERLETFASTNAYLDYPILKYLFVPGTYLWCYLILIGILLLRKKYSLLIPHAFVLGYYLTMLFGPTVQLRYLYPLMACLPFFIVFMTCDLSKKNFGYTLQQEESTTVNRKEIETR
ncbi:MAG: DUF6020 family protein, partial [Clostridium sp.]|nr:DUF6020 family protein [Clostridium sp.]